MIRCPKSVLVYTYTDLLIPYSDTKLVAVLCEGGPTKYTLKGRSGMSDNWLLKNAVPNIVKVCGKEVAPILASPILRSILHETKSYFVPWDTVERILSAYTGDRHVCPIKKIPLFIEGNEDIMNILKWKSLHLMVVK